MSRLNLYCRGTGTMQVDKTVGPPTGVPSQGLYALDGAVESIDNSERDHASSGLPINLLGRLIFAPGASIAYWDQGIPFSAAGNIVSGVGPITYYHQGIGFNAAGEVVTT